MQLLKSNRSFFHLPSISPKRCHRNTIAAIECPLLIIPETIADSHRSRNFLTTYFKTSCIFLNLCSSRIKHMIAPGHLHAGNSSSQWCKPFTATIKSQVRLAIGYLHRLIDRCIRNKTFQPITSGKGQQRQPFADFTFTGRSCFFGGFGFFASVNAKSTQA